MENSTTEARNEATMHLDRNDCGRGFNYDE